MSLIFYVYYKVEPGSETPARERAQALFAGIRAQYGIQGRLLRRRDDPSTWMEIYEGVSATADFEASLVKAANSLEFIDVLKTGSARHLEVFQDL